MGKIGFFVLGFMAFVLVLFAGCGKASQKVEEKIQEKIAEEAIGADVDISGDDIKIEKDGNTYQAGEDLSWKEDDMGGLPEPKAKITSLMNTEMGGFASFEEMSEEDARDYVQKIIELGYTENALNIEEGDMLNYTAKHSNGASISFSYTISSKDGSINYISAGAGQ